MRNYFQQQRKWVLQLPLKMLKRTAFMTPFLEEASVSGCNRQTTPMARPGEQINSLEGNLRAPHTGAILSSIGNPDIRGLVGRAPLVATPAFLAPKFGGPGSQRAWRSVDSSQTKNKDPHHPLQQLPKARNK